MIEYGKNGHAGGLFLIRALLGKGLLMPSDQQIAYRAGSHVLTGLTFSPQIRKNRELSRVLPRLSEDLARLFFYVEKREDLKVPRYLISDELGALLWQEDLTGMTFLNLFARGAMALRVRDGKYRVVADPLILQGVQGSRERIRALLEAAAEFSGDPAPDPEIVPGKLLLKHTERIGEGMVLSFTERPEGADDLWEEFLSTGTPAPGLWTDDPRGETVRENAEDALTRISTMMTALDDSNDAVRADLGRLELCYGEGRTVGRNTYTAEIPDGFLYAETDGGLLLWLPNPENPGEAEASYFTVTVEDAETSAALPDRIRYESTLVSGHLKAEAFVRTEGGACRIQIDMKGVESREEGDRFIRDILAHIR